MNKTAYVDGVEAHIASVPEIICAMTDNQKRESRVRVRAALNAWKQPTEGLGDWYGAQACVKSDLPRLRSSATFDLPIMLAFLGKTWEGICVGELSLDGNVRAVRGLTPILRAAIAAGMSEATVPKVQVEEACCLGLDIEILCASSLDALADKVKPGSPPFGGGPPTASSLPDHMRPLFETMMQAIRDKQHVLLVGSAGSGKTMLARRIVGHMLPLEREEELDIASIHSAAGLPYRWPIVRPFRAPHHTASEAAILGGGAAVRPGELTLAHHGVLFLDQTPEFSRRTLEAVGQAVRKGKVVIPRLGHRTEMPSAPIVVMAAGDCPCMRERACRCTEQQIAAYHARMTPILDALQPVIIPVHGQTLSEMLEHGRTRH